MSESALLADPIARWRHVAATLACAFQRNLMAKKKMRSMRWAIDRREKHVGAGPNSHKTRADVLSTPANKAATGKQTRSKR